MADRYAVADGPWSDVATWDGGTDLPAPGDGVYANGFAVALDMDVDVAFIANDDLGATLTAGGYFMFESVDEFTGTLTLNFSSGLDGSTHFSSEGSFYGGSDPSLLFLAWYGDGGVINVNGTIIGPAGNWPSAGYVPASMVTCWGSGTTYASFDGDLYGGVGGGCAVVADGPISVSGSLYGGVGDADHYIPGAAVHSNTSFDVIVGGSVWGGDSTLCLPFEEGPGEPSVAFYGYGNLLFHGHLEHGTTPRDWVAVPYYSVSFESYTPRSLADVEERISDSPEGNVYASFDEDTGYTKIAYWTEWMTLEEAYNRAGDLEYIFSDPATIITPPLTVTAVYDDAVTTLAWEPPFYAAEEVTGYEIELSATEDFADIVLSGAVDGVTLTYDAAGTMEPGPVFARVRAISATLAGDWAMVEFEVFGISGWLTVTAEGLVGFADTADGNLAPDYIHVVGSVVLTPSISRPIRLEEEVIFFCPAPVTATFDSLGKLSYDGMEDIRLIAPLWENLSNTDWRWIAQIKPGPGQTWNAWSVGFTGGPGDVVNLADLL